MKKIHICLTICIVFLLIIIPMSHPFFIPKYNKYNYQKISFDSAFNNSPPYSLHSLTAEVTLYTLEGTARQWLISIPPNSIEQIIHIFNNATSFEEAWISLESNHLAFFDSKTADFIWTLNEMYKENNSFFGSYNVNVNNTLGENETKLSFNIGCIFILTGHGRAITRITTFVKAFLNQIFGRIFGIMPPFFTIFPEFDILLSQSGGLMSLGLIGGSTTFSPVYFTALIGFVGLHWRILEEPFHVFMGAAGAICAFGVPRDE